MIDPWYHYVKTISRRVYHRFITTRRVQCHGRSCWMIFRVTARFKTRFFCGTLAVYWITGADIASPRRAVSNIYANAARVARSEDSRKNGDPGVNIQPSAPNTQYALPIDRLHTPGAFTLYLFCYYPLGSRRPSPRRGFYFRPSRTLVK